MILKGKIKKRLCELCGEPKKTVKLAVGVFYVCEICDGLTRKSLMTYEVNGETRH